MDLEKLQQFQDEQKQAAEKKAATVLDVALSKGVRKEIERSSVKSQQTLVAAAGTLIKFLQKHQPEVTVKNLPKFTDISTADLEAVSGALDKLTDAVTTKEFTPITEALNALQTAIREIPEAKESVEVTNQIDYSAKFDELMSALSAIDVRPEVNVKPEVKVTNDFKEVISKLSDLQKAIGDIKIPEAPKTDIAPLQKAMADVKNAINSLSFPVPNYVLPFRDNSGKSTQANLDANGNLIVTELGANSSTVSSVASSATNVSILAANTSRKGATFFNDADKSCYLKFGTTASTSSFTIRIFANGFFSIPYPAYTGAIDAIWESSPTGSLRITEF